MPNDDDLPPDLAVYPSGIEQRVSAAGAAVGEVLRQFVIGGYNDLFGYYSIRSTSGVPDLERGECALRPAFKRAGERDKLSSKQQT
jgi:hypothetical protein